MGVWIETYAIDLQNRIEDVTPFVGVWIETSVFDNGFLRSSGHTLRGCVD